MSFTDTLADEKTIPIANQFADHLIKEKYLLTALEFYYELLERGITNSQLNEFFSNPQNFDRLESTTHQLSPQRITYIILFGFRFLH